MNQNQKVEMKNNLFKNFKISNFFISKIIENKSIDFKHFESELNNRIIKEETDKNNG